MNDKKKGVIAVLMVFFPMACMAQGEDDGPLGFVYSTYHICNVATQDQLDEVVAEHDKPVMDKAVKDGRMTGWGYYSHMTGGQWRKLQYHTAATIQEVLHNQETIFAEIYEGNEEAGKMRGGACWGHDDYIWAVMNGNPPNTGGDDPKSSLSVYYECDFMREDNADQIVASAHAPVLNKLVADGKLDSWGWLAHRVGGKYRRLQTFTGESHEQVLAARGALLQATGGPQGLGFGEICGSHTDYLWDIVH